MWGQGHRSIFNMGGGGEWLGGASVSIAHLHIQGDVQGRSQPHSPGWARVPLSSFFPQILIKFSYFSSNFTSFLPHFGPPGGASRPPGKALATPLGMCPPQKLENILYFWNWNHAIWWIYFGENILYFWNWNRAVWWILVGTNLEQAMCKKKKEKKKHSSLVLTDPNFAFQETFLINFARIIKNPPFLEQNLLIWADFLQRISQNIVNYSQY